MVLPTRRKRVLHARKYRGSGKINKHLYHELYLNSKGNQLKSTHGLIGHIDKVKVEHAGSKHLANQILEVRRSRNQAMRARRAERITGMHADPSSLLELRSTIHEP